MKTLLTTAVLIPGSLILSLAVVPAWAACTPLGDPGAGCVPPDKVVAKCETKVAYEAQRLLRRIIKCHVVQADRPNISVVDACEQLAGASFDARVGKLLASGECPACLNGVVPALGDAIEAFADASNGEVFCDGTVPLGEATGFFPPTGFAYTCERFFAFSSGSFGKGIAQCVSRAATYGAVGRAFDEAACEAKAGASIAARRAEFLRDHIHCPPCVLAGNAGALVALLLETVIHPAAYCAPTS